MIDEAALKLVDQRKNLTFLLNERARTCSYLDHRLALKVAASKLRDAETIFTREPTGEHLLHLIGLWTAGVRVLCAVPPEPDPLPPLSGAPEAAKLSEAA